jgi:hypothetical protein
VNSAENRRPPAMLDQLASGFPVSYGHPVVLRIFLMSMHFAHF